VIFEPELETMAREELQALQMERLRGLVAYVKERIPLYRERLAGLEPGDIASLDDLRRLPFTRKDDLRDTYPFGLFAVPREEAVRVQASSGTTGKLTVVGYTAADVELFAVVNARSLAMAGAEPGMMLHNAYGYGLFTGGLGLHYGGERLGLTVVPVSGGLTERQLMLITDFRPDVILCTPSYALTLAQAFAESGVGPDEISLRYASSEPSPGRKGVLVFTTLTKQALPLVRYWTGDITSLSSTPCSCGRTFVRMSLITGRADDMLIIRGVNVYPTQVEAALLQVPELTSNYRIVVTRSGTLDEAEVEVEVDEGVLGDDALRSRAEQRLRESIGCSCAASGAGHGTPLGGREAPARARPPDTCLTSLGSEREPDRPSHPPCGRRACRGARAPARPRRRRA
jgi:phenylacetate-coenzyme A ligase PaaK-like adenylate-forming protein